MGEVGDERGVWVTEGVGEGGRVALKDVKRPGKGVFTLVRPLSSVSPSCFPLNGPRVIPEV